MNKIFEHLFASLFISLTIQSNIIASAGLGGEVFVWDLDAACAPILKAAVDENTSEKNSTLGPSAPITSSDRSLGTSFSTATQNSLPSQGYTPIMVKGHKESVYALAMNDSGTILVSGGTEKVVECALKCIGCILCHLKNGG